MVKVKKDLDKEELRALAETPVKKHLKLIKKVPSKSFFAKQQLFQYPKMG